MCVTVNIHPPMLKTRIPASVGSVTFNIPTTHLSYTYMSVSSKSGSETLKSDQAKCHAPFSSREHVGSIMSNMSCHVVMSCRHVMSCHVIMSCHVVTLETDPCVCHCQYSPTHVKDHNPCLCAKCQFSNPDQNVKFNQYKKTGSSGVKGRVRSNSITIENLKLVGSVQRASNPDQNVKFNHYKNAGSSGVKGRVRSYSIYIGNLKLVGSVQRGSNPDQNVKFNHYKNAGSSGVKGRVRSYSIYIENLKLVGSVQRGSNPDQNVKFNQYKNAGSSGVKGRLAPYPPTPGFQQ